ncbi:uncharacterized protein LOC115355794 [Myripristis murdjan]|uniref:uncharacterized protein LOC115355794 n=1 Tax=Myripristis murdjan TaxID=586833 RepID=UPI001175F71C|nr:uncharacterized protein LOC115355794 [Myripristis murdjan]
MSVLLEKIRKLKSDAARTLELAELRSDSDIVSLTQEELRDLFPGPKNFKLRKAIREIIHNQKPINVLLEDLRAFIPDEAFRDALTENGSLYHYLVILKGLKDQINNVQAFIDAHIDVLEQCKDSPKQTSDRGTIYSGTNAAVGHHNYQAAASPSRSQALVPAGNSRFAQKGPVTVKYRSVISGKTFGAHDALLHRVQEPGGLKLVEGNLFSEPHITFVFCPISSRHNTDVDAAMKMTSADKPIILVIMHHTYDPNFMTPRKTDTQNILLEVNVLYHDSAHGLLNCPKNDQAVAQIRETLMQCNSGDGSSKSWWTGWLN